MNKAIATALINAELEKLRTQAYEQLVKRIANPEYKEAVGEDGKTYQLQIEAFWDSQKGVDVRVMVAADDGGWRAFFPLAKSFIKAPDGHFIGE